MKRIAFLVVAGATVAGVATSTLPASGQADGEAVPIYGVKLPPGYRDWSLISVAHIGGSVNDMRAKTAATNFAPRFPIRRVVGPADVAALALHIMTNTALTGATYDIDGGQQLVAG
jgi:hypothetical protein